MNHAVIKSRENQITQQVGLNLPKMQEKMNQSEFGWFDWNSEFAKLLTTSSEFYAMLKKKKECLFFKGCSHQIYSSAWYPSGGFHPILLTEMFGFLLTVHSHFQQRVGAQDT